jgi:hypothetical protein
VCVQSEAHGLPLHLFLFLSHRHLLAERPAQRVCQLDCRIRKTGQPIKSPIVSHVMKSRAYSTGDAAKKAGISRATLQAWIASGKINPPKAMFLGKVTVRLWTKSDLVRLIRTKSKIYWKGQGRPKKSK